MLKKTLIVFICLCCSSLFSQNFYGVWYGANSNILNKMTLSCGVQQLSICQPTYESPFSGDAPYLDIAVDRQYLYSVTQGGVLYRQNLSGPLNCQILGTFGCFVNALVADSAGILYAIGKDSGLTYYLLRYSAGSFSNLGALPSPYKSAGDLFFYNHHLFLTTYSTPQNPLLCDDYFLMDIDMITPSQSCIYMPLPFPSGGIAYWGTFAVWDGALSHVYTQANYGIQEIDMKCRSLGAGTCTILSGGCRGFASWYPFTSSNSVPNCSIEIASLITSTTQVCQGQTATLTANGWGTYTWSVPGSQPIITVTPSATTVYSISGTSSMGCPTLSYATIYVSPVPTLMISGQKSLCMGSTLSLSVTGAQSYSWSTGAFTSVIYSVPQVNTVYSVTGSGSNGCTASTQFSVTISECLDLEDRTDKIAVTVFPNPGRVPFECVSDVFIREAIVFDGLAQEIKRISNCGTRFMIEDLKPGTYFLLLATGQETLSIKLVVLE